MNIEQFELILCDMYTMDAWSPPLLWKWKKEFKEASTKQWAIRELVLFGDYGGTIYLWVDDGTGTVSIDFRQGRL